MLLNQGLLILRVDAEDNHQATTPIDNREPRTYSPHSRTPIRPNIEFTRDCF